MIVAAEALQAKPAKKKREKLPPTSAPIDCSLLAVDPGELSGWSLWRAGVLRDYAECDLFGAGPQLAIARLLAMPGPHAVIVERPFRVRFGTQTGVGTGDVTWRRLAERAGLARRIVRVFPSSWRARVLPPGWNRLERDNGLKDLEFEVARRLAVETFCAAAAELGAESCAAVLIGRYGCSAGEVFERLPKRARRLVSKPY